MFVILSPRKTYFTGTWLEKDPPQAEMTDDPERAMTYPSKLAAIEFVRETSNNEMAAEYVPTFTACRVVSLADELARIAIHELRSDGYKPEFNESRTMIWLHFNPKVTSIEKAIATYPREHRGFSIRLKAAGVPLPWNHKRSS